MSTELAPNDLMDLNDLLVVSDTEKLHQADPALAAAEAAAFSPYIQFITAKKKNLKDLGGVAMINHFGLWTAQDKKPSHDLGETFVAWFLGWRKKAVELDSDNRVIAVCYDINNPEYDRIKTKSKADGLSGAFEGYEWGLYLPDQDVCATFHFSGKSMPYEEAKFRGSKGKFIRFKHREAHAKGFDYETVALELADRQMPANFNKEMIQAFGTKFITPKDRLPELAPPEDTQVER